jgi:uncharacterized protein (TIGR02118 family)
MHRITIEYADPADPAAFDRRYEDEHVPLVRRLPGLARFAVSRPRGLGSPAPYLVAELWFDDAEAMKAAMRSPEMEETAAHAQGFEVASMTMFTGEVVDLR